MNNIYKKINDIYHNLIYGVPNFFRNLFYFRKVLWDFHNYDYVFNLMMLKRSLESSLTYYDSVNYNGDISSHKKMCDKIKRSIELINNIIENNYLERVKTDSNKGTDSLYNDADKLEKNEWNELFSILKGQDDQFEIADIIHITEKPYDGSGMRTWWL